MAEPQYVIEAEWDRPSLPRLIGPFASRQEADDWGRLNVVNGSWNVAPLTYPYRVSAGCGDPTLTEEHP